MMYKHISINEKGHLCLNHKDLVEIAKKYQTPLYVMDEIHIRENIQRMRNAMKQAFGDSFQILYASKACDFVRMYEICKEENIGADVISSGEIYSAYKAGFDMSQLYYHGNSKTISEIELAMDLGVGCIVIDNEEEINRLEKIADKHQIIQKVLLRVTPGIDSHTFEAVTTGIVDCKFGNAITTQTAENMIKLILKCPHLHLAGIHCHIGSQIFDVDVYRRCTEIMMDFMIDVSVKYHLYLEEINLGGGFGVRYQESDEDCDIEGIMMTISQMIHTKCKEAGLSLPKVLIEPGRSIVADAGITLYQVNGVKRIPQGDIYVAVDGGMSDNPRYALYKSRYTAKCINKMHEIHDMICTLAGRCCESGDLITKGCQLPVSIQENDLIAVLTTGAYNYSMSSNYNRFLKPAVVMITEKGIKVAVHRETLDDLIRNDCYGGNSNE